MPTRKPTRTTMSPIRSVTTTAQGPSFSMDDVESLTHALESAEASGWLAPIYSVDVLERAVLYYAATARLVLPDGEMFAPWLEVIDAKSEIRQSPHFVAHLINAGFVENGPNWVLRTDRWMYRKPRSVRPNPAKGWRAEYAIQPRSVCVPNRPCDQPTCPTCFPAVRPRTKPRSVYGEAQARWSAILKKWAPTEHEAQRSLPSFPPPKHVPARILADLLLSSDAASSMRTLSTDDWEDAVEVGRGQRQRTEMLLAYAAAIRQGKGHHYQDTHVIDQGWRKLSHRELERVLRAAMWSASRRAPPVHEHWFGHLVQGRTYFGEGFPRSLGTIAADTQATLARFAPYERAVLMERAVERAETEATPGHSATVRTRHLNWEALRALQERERAISPARRSVVRAATSVKESGGSPRSRSYLARMSPYPDMESQIQARLLLGERPVDIMPGLTAREAHRWLQEGGRLRPEEIILHEGTSVMSIPVARWLSAVLRDPKRKEALERERELRGPHGEVQIVRFAGAINNLIPEDLPRGEKTSVTDAFENMIRRVSASQMEAFSKEHRLLAPSPVWERPYHRVRRLATPAELVAEGEVMGHCVGGYVPYVEQGKSHMYSIRVGKHRSTVEIDPSGKVAQHRGVSNEPPDPLCERALAIFLKRRKT